MAASSRRTSRRTGSNPDRHNSDSGIGSLSDRSSPRPVDLDRVFTAQDLKEQLDNPLAVREALRAKQADLERLKLEIGRLRDENLRLRGEFHELERGFHEMCDSEKLLRDQAARLAQKNNDLTLENDTLARDYDALEAHTHYLADLVQAAGVHAPTAPKATSSSRSSRHKTSDGSDKPPKDRQKDRLSRRFDSAREDKESSSRRPKTTSSNPAEVYVEVYNTSGDRRRHRPVSAIYPSYVATSNLDNTVYAPPLGEPNFASVPRSAMAPPKSGGYSPKSRHVSFMSESGTYFPHELPERIRKR